MTATLTAPSTYEVIESDAAWEAILADCEAHGSVVIKGKDGLPFQLLPAGDFARSRSIIVTAPDFATRRAKIGDTKLESVAETAFFSLLRGD